MAAFEGVKNNKLNGGLGATNPSNDAVVGVIGGGAAATGLALGEILTILQPSDAVAVGIDAAYDANNKVLVYHHISEFFRLQPAGKMFLMLVAQGTTMANMVDKDQADNLMKLILDEQTAREIKSVGVVLNPAAAYAPVYTTGVDADVLAAIPKAQALVDELASRSIYIDSIVLEGRLEADAAVGNLPDLRVQASRNVSIVIAADPVIAALDAEYARYAAVGSTLGMIAIRKVNECIGSADIEVKPSGKEAMSTYPLTGNGLWLSASLSSGQLFSKLSINSQKSIENKGYIFAGKYEGMAGIYLNDSPTCIELADDYAWIEQNRTWNKAARLIRAALLPKMKSSVDIDETSGQIKATTIAVWETLAEKAVKAMLKNNEVSAVEVVIDPTANVLAGDPLVSLTTVTPRGIARDVINNLGFSNPSN